MRAPCLPGNHTHDEKGKQIRNDKLDEIWPSNLNYFEEKRNPSRNLSKLDQDQHIS